MVYILAMLDRNEFFSIETNQSDNFRLQPRNKPGDIYSRLLEYVLFLVLHLRSHGYCLEVEELEPVVLC
jgi:hypothetical protein